MLPALLVARTLSSWSPAASFTGSVHSRNEYFPRSLPSLSRRPGLTTVDRNRDRLDALAAIEGDALERRSAQLELRAVGHIGNERADSEAVDRNRRLGRGARLNAAAGRIRNPVGGLHPETVEHIIDHVDVIEVLTHKCRSVRARRGGAESR